MPHVFWAPQLTCTCSVVCSLHAKCIWPDYAASNWIFFMYHSSQLYTKKMSGFVRSACKIEICIEALLQNQALCPGVPKSVRIFLMCTQFLVTPPITQVEILWYAGAKSTDRKDQRPWSNASKVCSSTTILWTIRMFFLIEYQPIEYVFAYEFVRALAPKLMFILSVLPGKA